MKASELLTKCEEKTSWKNVLSLLDSFTDKSEDYKKIIADNKLEGAEIDKFIEVCDIEIERAKTLMKEMGTVAGIFIAIMSIILSKIIIEKIGKSTDQIGVNLNDILLAVFVSLVIGAVLFSAFRAHYRLHIHAWTAFKEATVVSENYNPKKR